MIRWYRYVSLLLLLVFSRHSKSFCQYTPNNWVSETSVGSFPVPGRYFGASFTIGGTLYLGTGYNSAGALLTDFWSFNSFTGTWTSLPPFPGAARADAVGFSVNGIGYLGLGDNGATSLYDMYKYDPSTNTWSATASLPTSGTGTSNATAFAIDGNAYVCLGTVVPATIYNYYSDLYEYDPATDSWTLKTSFPGAARNQAVSFVLNGKGYVGTGINASGSFSDFYVYDPSANSWTSIAPIPGNGRYGGAAFSMCGYGYAGLGPAVTDFYQYDPGTNLWAAMADYGGTTTLGVISAATNNDGDTSFGFIGLGGASHVAVGTDFYKYYPPQPCIPLPTGLNTVASNNDLIIFPNPATTLLTISSPAEAIAQVLITNVTGQTVILQDYAAKIVEVDISGLLPGLYFVKINQVRVARFVKQ